jgi:hypothetical protein
MLASCDEAIESDYSSVRRTDSGPKDGQSEGRKDPRVVGHTFMGGALNVLSSARRQ